MYIPQYIYASMQWLAKLWLFILAISQISSSYSQSEANWTLVSTRILSRTLPYGAYLSIGNNADIFVPGAGIGSASFFNGTDGSYLNSVDVPQIKPYWVDSYNITLIDTVQAEEFFPEWINPCTNVNQKLFAVYDGEKNGIETFCIGFPYEIWGLDSYPFDPYITLANNTYLINLRLNTWQDLTPQLPAQVSIADTQQWLGSGLVWWDGATRLPMARIIKQSDFHDFHEPITQQWVQLCGMTLRVCSDLFRLTIPQEGAIGDLTLSTDGKTLLWVKRLFQPNTDYILAYAAYNQISDVVAYATNIADNTSLEIFRASQYMTTPDTRPIETAWSPDGQTLAISLQQRFPEAVENTGLLLATFTHDNPASTLPE